MVWDLLERPLWFVAACIFLMGFVLYFKNAKLREKFNDRVILYGYSGVLLNWFFSVLFMYIKELCVPGSFRNFIFYGDYSKTGFCYELFYKLAFGIAWTMYTFFFLTFELSTKRTKYVLTTLGLIFTVVFFLVPYKMLTDLAIDAIVFSFLSSLFLFIQILFMKWSDMEFKALSSFIILGITFVGLGATFTFVEVKVLNKNPLFIAPLFIV